MKVQILMFFVLFYKMILLFFEKFDDVRFYLIVYNFIYDWIISMFNEEYVMQNEVLCDVKDVKLERSLCKYVND